MAPTFTAFGSWSPTRKKITHVLPPSFPAAPISNPGDRNAVVLDPDNPAPARRG